MKNFLETLVTDLHLEIVVNGTATQAGLHDHLIFAGTDNVTIDNIEILPKYQHLVQNNVLTISEPFYCWYHRISGQGWLLTPN